MFVLAIPRKLIACATSEAKADCVQTKNSIVRLPPYVSLQSGAPTLFGRLDETRRGAVQWSKRGLARRDSFFATATISREKNLR